MSVYGHKQIGLLTHQEFEPSGHIYCEQSSGTPLNPDNSLHGNTATDYFLK